MSVFDEMTDFFKTLDGPSPAIGLKKDALPIPAATLHEAPPQKPPVGSPALKELVRKQLQLEKIQREKGLPRDVTKLHEECAAPQAPVESEYQKMIRIQQQQGIPTDLGVPSDVTPTLQSNTQSQSVDPNRGIDQAQGETEYQKMIRIQQQQGIPSNVTTPPQLEPNQQLPSVDPHSGETEYQKMIRIQQQQGIPESVTTPTAVNTSTAAVTNNVDVSVPSNGETEYQKMIRIQQQHGIPKELQQPQRELPSAVQTEHERTMQVQNQTGIPTHSEPATVQQTEPEPKSARLKYLEEQLNIKMAEHKATLQQDTSLSTALSGVSRELQIGFENIESTIAEVMNHFKQSQTPSFRSPSASSSSPEPGGGKKVAFNLDRNQYRSYYQTVMAEQRGEELSQADEDRMMAEQLQRVFNDELKGRAEGYGPRHGRRRKR
eukprot:TRINITY_DN1206_c0_g2_i1.p1 TRINITY_DN1206_c0_g2~~TRINITY_DN1206_c0_g2_i1.p1  ORF type:complete len:461 (+),score=104.21 TRINITY_DN1206_c0_g2_i1:87-1385(+)